MQYKPGDQFWVKTGNGEYVRATVTVYLGGGYYSLRSEAVPFTLTLSEKTMQKICREFKF